MKKKKRLLACLLCTALFFTACSKESRGVPDSVVLRDASVSTNEITKYQIKHDVDTDAHIDELQLITEYKGKYGIKTQTTPYTYMYDKSTDIWTLLNKGYSDAVYSVDKQAYIDSSPWTGRESMNGWWYQYNITIYKIDESSVTVSYRIDFEHENDWLNDIIQDTPTELYLSTFGDIPEFKIALAGEGYKTQYLKCRLGIYGLNKG